PDTPVDVFHTNSLEVLREDIPGIARAGNILLSVRQLNSIMIVDLEEEESIWYWGQQRIQRQHHASVLKNGNLLLLDNGTFREHSRGIELNPRSEEIVWSYGSRKNQRFFCTFRGGIQRLPNGNTLITNADQDVAFELTPDKRKVWSLTLRAPNSGGDDDGSQQIMYRMRRLPLEHNFVQRLMQLESQT
ncbi:MAG: hypothetical protein KDD62_02145, partial [Bdellovibrionales bacterium]|nr:hypothetical protein [Bdellovibrionales bacterium]